MMTGSIEHDQPSLEDLISLSEAAQISGLSPESPSITSEQWRDMGEKIRAELVYYRKSCQRISWTKY